MKMKPLKIERPFEDGTPEIIVWGRCGGTSNWKKIINPDESDDSQLMSEAILDFIPKNVGKIFSPETGTFNAKICRAEDLNKQIPLGKNTSIYRGFEAEGMIIPKNCAGILLPADCYTIIIKSKKGEIGFAHAGSLSLVDSRAILDNDQKKPHGSVVEAIIDEFKLLGNEPKDLSVFVIKGIGKKDFTYNPRDKVSEEKNKKLLANFSAINPGAVSLETGAIDLMEIIKSQLLKAGVLSKNIKNDSTDTYNDKDTNGDFLWWSHRRAKNEGRLEEARAYRNMVLIVHH